MRRDEFLGRLVGMATLPLAACAAPTAPLRPDPGELVYDLDHANRLRPTEEWRAMLTPGEFAVLFEEATEPPGSSPLTNESRPGTYVCAACFVPLFSSAAKYDSKTGWPTFWQASSESSVGFKPDYVLGYERTEYHCRRCGGHQGHLFDDGPDPTGKRFCNNGLALRFYPIGEQLPEWR
jgi:peptide-methionine (R)-S-oxide reductase